MGEPDFKVYCSFCNDEFSSSKAMMDHLMTCGNKTDQCPNCRKYVRRAIFAYHYENGCANPDDPTPNDETPQKPSYPIPIQITVTCPFCNLNHDKADSRIHREKCLLNPKNMAKAQQQSINDDYNWRSDRSHQNNDSENDARIPCEWCNKGISWFVYEDHIKACREEYQRQQQRSRQGATAITTAVPLTPVMPLTGTCVHCGTNRSMEGLLYHQMCCTKNPRRTGTR